MCEKYRYLNQSHTPIYELQWCLPAFLAAGAPRQLFLLYSTHQRPAENYMTNDWEISET